MGAGCGTSRFVYWSENCAHWLYEYNIGTMTYDEIKQSCLFKETGIVGNGGVLASKQLILDHLTKEGIKFGGDVWTPVIDTYNDWLQIGDGSVWEYGLLHTETSGGTPEWGMQKGSASFKRVYYCDLGNAAGEIDNNDNENNNNDNSDALLVNNIGPKNYAQCSAICDGLGLTLASRQQVIDFLDAGDGAYEGDSWTPVSDNDNNWIQIGDDGSSGYGVLLNNPGWSTEIRILSYKQVFFCYGSISFDITEYEIGTKSYDQCSSSCKDTGGVLANRGHVLNYLEDIPQGGDSWTPVVVNNDWLQIGGEGPWRFGLLHTEIGSGIKPSWGASIGSLTYKKTFYCFNELQEYDIGTKNYEQCRQYCQDKGSSLATKEQVLAYLDLAKGGDIWTPVSNDDNNWLQIGGSIWPFGLLHSEATAAKVKPSWGTSTGSRSYKDTFYCSKINLIKFDIGTKNYDQCLTACEDKGGLLASKAQIIYYLDSNSLGGDSWTPVIDTYNDWLQIGGSVWQFGLTHSEQIGNTPGWGDDIGSLGYKKVFYCNL